MMKNQSLSYFLMRLAYLECFSGMSGDMFLGALVDAGIPARAFEEAVSALNVGARLEISRVMRSGISATKVDVWVDGEKDRPREKCSNGEHDQIHEHPHEHDGHENSHRGGVSRDETKAPRAHSLGRGLTEIRQIISAAA